VLSSGLNLAGTIGNTGEKRACNSYGLLDLRTRLDADPHQLLVFADKDSANAWFKEFDAEGVALEYSVIGKRCLISVIRAIARSIYRFQERANAADLRVLVASRTSGEPKISASFPVPDAPESLVSRPYPRS
jgi:hypothetical protein